MEQKYDLRSYYKSIFFSSSPITGGERNYINEISEKFETLIKDFMNARIEKINPLYPKGSYEVYEKYNEEMKFIIRSMEKNMITFLGKIQEKPGLKYNDLFFIRSLISEKRKKLERFNIDLYRLVIDLREKIEDMPLEYDEITVCDNDYTRNPYDTICNKYDEMIRESKIEESQITYYEKPQLIYYNKYVINKPESKKLIVKESNAIKYTFKNLINNLHHISEKDADLFLETIAKALVDKEQLDTDSYKNFNEKFNSVSDYISDKPWDIEIDSNFVGLGL